MVLPLAVAADAADLEVGPSAPWTDLQAALDAANDGDTVLIHGPQWNGSYVAARDVTLAAYPGDVVTLVPDGSAGSGTVATDGFLLVDGGQVGVVGLTLDGLGQYRLARVTNGGVLSTGDATLRNGFGDDGGCILGQANASVIVGPGSVLEDCQASGNGGAVALLAGSSLLSIVEARFARNTALNGGAAYCEAASCLDIRGNVVDNEAVLDAGALFVAGSGATFAAIDGGRFCRNSAGQYGGAARLDDATASASVSWAVFGDNDATLSGGAIYTTTDLTVHNVDFVGNASVLGAAVAGSGANVDATNVITTEHTFGALMFDSVSLGFSYGWCLSYNDVVPWAGVSATLVGTPTLLGDPRFVDAPAGGDCETADLHLLPSSPAKGSGDGYWSFDVGAFPCDEELPGDGVDGDCDGQEDCYDDADFDGFGDGVVHTADLTCGPPFVAVGGDCQGDDATQYPGAAEIVADGVDQDCDGTDLCWVDSDSDGFGGLLQAPALDCTAFGLALVGGDCDDADETAAPGFPETACDGIDQDCSGLDLGAGAHPDADDDGFGDGALTLCDPYGITDGTDCDDTRADVHPGGSEVECDGVDQDCSGADLVVDGHADVDHDGYGDPSAAVTCDPEGVTDASDCDDVDPARNPGAEDVPCDGIDQDCTYADAEVGCDGGSTDDPPVGKEVGALEGGVCSCAHGGPGGPIAVLVAVIAMARGRRRPRLRPMPARSPPSAGSR